jgi:hypothetical protein
MVARPSPETVLLFLKHAALEPGWTPTDVAETLGVDAATAKQIVDELTLVGYAEPASGKREEWRNTVSGNTVSGAKPPRLTQATATELLTDLADRVEAFNHDDERPVRIDRIRAFGGVNTKHERVQDVDLGVQLEPKLGRAVTDTDIEAALKAVRGRSPSLKTHALTGWPQRMGRVVWER